MDYRTNGLQFIRHLSCKNCSLNYNAQLCNAQYTQHSDTACPLPRPLQAPPFFPLGESLGQQATCPQWRAVLGTTALPATPPAPAPTSPSSPPSPAPCSAPGDWSSVLISGLSGAGVCLSLKVTSDLASGEMTGDWVTAGVLLQKLLLLMLVEWHCERIVAFGKKRFPRHMKCVVKWPLVQVIKAGLLRTLDCSPFNLNNCYHTFHSLWRTTSNEIGGIVLQL